MKPFFLLSSTDRNLFCLHFAAQGERKGAVLLLPPWGEEMHKSRHVLSQAARAMAASGWDVLLFDLMGTGDSEGMFGEASWDEWLADCRIARDWLVKACPGPLYLWGMRTGALLASGLLAQAPCDGVLLWQPVVAGKTFLTQLLRLKLAGALEPGAEVSLNTAPVLKALRDGEPQEIAGYLHDPTLLLPLEEAQLDFAPGQAARIVWFELSSRTPPDVLPGSRRLIDKWQAAGVPVVAEAINGPAFWQSAELEFCPELVRRTVMALEAS